MFFSCAISFNYPSVSPSQAVGQKRSGPCLPHSSLFVVWSTFLPILLVVSYSFAIFTDVSRHADKPGQSFWAQVAWLLRDMLREWWTEAPTHAGGAPCLMMRACQGPSFSRQSVMVMLVNVMPFRKTSHFRCVISPVESEMSQGSWLEQFCEMVVGIHKLKCYSTYVRSLMVLVRHCDRRWPMTDDQMAWRTNDLLVAGDWWPTRTNDKRAKLL